MKQWQDLTDMIHTSDVCNEMEKKYKNTWLLLEQNNKQQIIRFHGFTGNQFKFSDIYENELLLNKNTECKLSVPIIRQGLYQCNKLMVHIRYTAARQYRRGISNDSVICIEPVNTAQIDLFQFFKYYLKQQYPMSIKQALEELETNKKSSQVISNNFGIAKTKIGYLFLYQDVIIGKIEDNCIKVQHPHFYQEVMDSIRMINYSGFEVKYEQT